MNFDDYKNKLNAPRKTDFTTKYFYKRGQVVAVVQPGEPLPTCSLNGCVTETVVNDEAFAFARDQYSKMDRQLAEMFIIDILQDFGMPDNDFTRRLYEIAYANGHSSGLASVYDCFSDLSELDTLAIKVYGK